LGGSPLAIGVQDEGGKCDDENESSKNSQNKIHSLSSSRVPNDKKACDDASNQKDVE
jgi:hypothetical protein